MKKVSPSGVCWRPLRLDRWREAILSHKRSLSRVVAGEKGLEPYTFGFGDQRSTIETTLPGKYLLRAQNF